MPRPEIREITFSIDGREVTAPENTMLVDAAKLGDVEIPVFCYEPKLGAPVGACRMCLVEIEGIPKLQTGCSTPVKDGMVVTTQSARVQEAQQSVVEFLLINHPLDCPVCDKGGECPLQDISFGWGGGKSRFIEPKRHFVKPLELSPVIAIDRERCILCYRCVRFSQEISEDYQLVLLERGAHSYVGTFDGHPYVAPFSGNIIELCPVGALTSQPYRFRARPWDIEGSGSVCTLCPGQCNVTFTVRDDKVLRVLSRQNDGVDDGWLCDKGRFAYQSIHADERVTSPMLRDGGELRPVSWERALEAAASGLRRAKGSVRAVAGGGATNEEGFLLKGLLEGALDGSAPETRLDGGPSGALVAALAHPSLQASVPDIEFAHAVLVLDVEPVDDMAALDLRVRKGVRRNRVKLAIATSRPSSLDANADAVARFAPGSGEAFTAALNAALDATRPAHVLDELAAAAGTTAAEVRGIAEVLGAGSDVVVVWGSRLAGGPRADHGARALLNVAGRLGLGDQAGAGLLEVPAHGQANARGLREVTTGGDTEGDSAPLDAPTAVYLLDVDPLLDAPDRSAWDRRLERASTVVAHAAFLTEGIREHATVVFPAESYAEKDGTVTHPDGRVQRLRPAISLRDDCRYSWQVLAELSERLGSPTGVLTAGMAWQQITAAVPAYAGITLDEIGGRGVRWPERHESATADPGNPDPDLGPFGLDTPPSAAAMGSHPPVLRLGTYRSIWDSPEVDASPALQYVIGDRHVELSPADAQRLGLHHGERVVVAANGDSTEATVALRQAVPTGSAFLAGNALHGPTATISKKQS
ncbi:MAG TPA: NADH-quinone oxidoreductase subunit NuoG [Solirubrobacteraceae bacterium]|nr:NADH-quinone oxidoreductase subunit NuoG [Solirubrobacteraceae bacterium]